MTKYFTPGEAEALIPQLEEVFQNAFAIRDQAEARARELERLEAQGGTPDQIALARSRLQFLVEGINEWLNKIVTLGAMPKGLDPALVDFPYRLEGREVYLCWRLGEKRITHYHGIEDGFAGRQPLPGAPV